MILNVKPTSILKGKVKLPASKSYSIRSFIIAACGGSSTIIDPSDCDDAKVAIRVARSLGSTVKKLKGNRWKVSARQTKRNDVKIDVGESGTVLRLLLPLASMYLHKASIVGKGTLRGRPNLFLTRTLRKMGVDIKGTGKQESIPIKVQGGHLQGGDTEIDGSLSSQFVSALLISLPQLEHDSLLKLKGKKLVSLDYITMTLQVLKKAGIRVQQKDVRNYKIKAGQRFLGLKHFCVPSDYGLAAFLMAGASLIESNITLLGHLKNDLVQADGHILRLLRAMNARFTKTSTSIAMKGPFPLKGGDFSLKDCPDLVPIMSILALFAKGRTRLYGIKHARAKESDRISDLREELLKIGANVKEKQDELIIYPHANYRKDILLNPHNDHRLAMAFCILGIKLGVRVKDMECSHKSYPQFVKDIKALGLKARKG